MNTIARRAASLLIPLLMVAPTGNAAWIDQSDGRIDRHDSDPSPTAAESNINEYTYQDEQVNVGPDDGELRVGRFDQKNQVNEFHSKLIPVYNVSPRELRGIARQVCGLEGGYAQVVQDHLKKQYFIQVTCPPFQMPYVEATVRALDQEWLNATDDGTGLLHYKGKNRDVTEIDFLATRFAGAPPESPYSSSAYDRTGNSVTHANDPGFANSWMKVAQAVDIPPNQITVSAEFVEISTSNDLKIGLDFVAWKNGPGRNLFDLVLAGGQSVERFRGASSIYSPNPPAVESIVDDFWEVLRGDTAYAVTSGRQRYAAYNAFITAAYIDFLKTRGYARVLVSPVLQAVSGQVATWDSMSPVVNTVVTGSNNKTLYASVYPTYARRVAFIDDVLLAMELLAIDYRALEETLGTIREIYALSDEDVANLQRAADLMLVHLTQDNELLDALVTLLNNSGMLPAGIAITSPQLIHVLENINGSGDLGAWDRYLNYAQTGEVGASLSILPFVGLESTEMDIDAAVRSVTGLSPQGTPLIAVRNVTSRVRVRDGETLVLGGLKRKESVKQKSGVPVLSAIPLLGYLFGNETTQERSNDVVVTLTCTTSAGEGSLMEIPDNMQAVIADVEGSDNGAVPMPKRGFGFDQWLLGH